MKEAREHLARLLAQIKRQDLDAGPDDPLRPYVDILVNKCHAYGLDYAAAAPGSTSLALYSQLVELHRCALTRTYTHAHTHTHTHIRPPQTYTQSPIPCVTQPESHRPHTHAVSSRQ